jgi:starch-binding outer membrane protein SusE/F
MKIISKFLITAFLPAVMFWSCEKDENKIYFEGGTPPVLSASVSGDLNLNYADADKEALELNWTNPNYQFTTGISSQDVSYVIEIDTAGANFTNPQKQSIAVSKELSWSFTIAQINDYMLNQLQLQDSIPHTLEMRVVSSIANGAAPLPSNVLQFTATPYSIPPKVAPPATGHLYIVGNATSGGDATGWNNPVPVPEKEFTQVSPTLYEITIDLIGGKEYLFIPLNGDWGHKYACKETSEQSPDGGDFGYDWSDNFPGPATDGTYKISVDFQRGKYTVTKL